MVRGRLGRVWAKRQALALILAGAGATGVAGCGASTHANGEAGAGERASSFGGTAGGSGVATGGRPAESGAATGGATAGTTSVESGGSAQSTAGTAATAEAGTGSNQGGSPPMNGDGGAASSHEAIPSPGCALANTTPNLQEAPLYIKLALPAGYDGVTPLPLLFDLHATNAGSEYSYFKADPLFSQRYILVGPEPPSDLGGSFESVQKVTDLLTSTLDELLATLCVDESRLFATGDGSGGRVLTSWVAARQKAQTSPSFRALAIVGTYYGKYSAWPPTPLLFVHGLDSRNSMSVANDRDGTKAFAILSGMNACGQTSTPVNAERCPTQSSVDPGCVDLEGCAAPFRFCHYDGPAEEDIWPCFATAAVSEFFEPFRQ